VGLVEGSVEILAGRTPICRKMDTSEWGQQYNPHNRFPTIFIEDLISHHVRKRCVLHQKKHNFKYTKHGLPKKNHSNVPLGKCMQSFPHPKNLGLMYSIQLLQISIISGLPLHEKKVSAQCASKLEAYNLQLFVLAQSNELYPPKNSFAMIRLPLGFLWGPAEWACPQLRCELLLAGDDPRHV